MHEKLPIAVQREPDDAAAAWAAMRRLVNGNENVQEVRAAVGLGRGAGRVRALVALAHRSPLTLGELADELGVDAPYATLIVNHLEALGLVTRTPDSTDRRRKLVSPTKAGTQATARALAIQARPPLALQRLSPEEVAELRKLLERLAPPAKT
jgi:DNA-binding MarR family transcriptional regulator